MHGQALQNLFPMGEELGAATACHDLLIPIVDGLLHLNGDRREVDGKEAGGEREPEERREGGTVIGKSNKFLKN